jgi:hypothetical protein
MKMKKIYLMLMVIIPGLLFASPAFPVPVSYDLNYVYSGTINSSSPYARITMEGGFVDSDPFVQFELINLTPGNLAGGSSKLTDFYFNYTGSEELTFSDPANWNLQYGADSFKADGDAYYDFEIEALTNNYLATGSTLYFTIWGDNNPNHFVDLSIYNPGKKNEAPGIYHFAAHMQSLADPAGDSAWVADGVPVPEPGMLLLLGAGLLGLWAVSRRK